MADGFGRIQCLTAADSQDDPYAVKIELRNNLLHLVHTAFTLEFTLRQRHRLSCEAAPDLLTIYAENIRVYDGISCPSSHLRAISSQPGNLSFALNILGRGISNLSHIGFLLFPIVPYCKQESGNGQLKKPQSRQIGALD
ncbi:hypothetical protein D3C75_1033080 [compost metagenome]